MHLASALTCLRFISFGRYFVFWLSVFSSFRLAFFVFSSCIFSSFCLFATKRRNNATRKKRNNQKMPLEIRKDEITSDEKTKKKSLMKRPKKIRGLNGVILHGLFSSFRACFS